MGFLRQSLVIAGKDLRLELRSRERLVSMLTFAVLVAAVFNFARGVGVQPRDFGGAMLWVTILFAGMLGLGRSFTLEREQDAFTGLLLAPIDRGALYFGKLIANVVVLAAVVATVFLVYGLFFQLFSLGSIGPIVLVTALACTGFMALGTLFSAVTANTRLGDTLLPVILLPMLMPVVIFAAGATQRLLDGRPFAEVAGNARVLGAFALLFVVVCTLIFGWVVEE